MERLYIYGSIGWDVDAHYMRLALEEITGDIELRINSGGGDVFEGQAIYSLLEDYKRRNNARVVVHIDALAASIASIIAMAGDEIVISDGGMMMIHQPWTPESAGNASELRETADVLDKGSATLVSIYVNRTGLEPDTIVSLMDEETWLTASEAITLGFADTLASASEVTAASIQLFNYVNAPAWLADVEPVVPGNDSAKPRLSVAKARLAHLRSCNKSQGE